MALLPLVDGPLWDLESQADTILWADRLKTRLASGSQLGTVHGILTTDQLDLRAEREYLTHSGDMDVLYRPGTYGRAYRPRSDRPTSRNRYSLRQDPWRETWIEDTPDQTLGGVWFPLASRPGITGGEWSFLCWPHRDPAGAIAPRQNYFHHLDRYQRARIRATMRGVPTRLLSARKALRRHLADKYGVPTWVIIRCCQPAREC